MGMTVPAQEDSEEVTARLDALYSDEPSAIDAELLDAQWRAVNDRW